MGKKTPTFNESLCKFCKHRHRRVFLILNPNEYVDENNKELFKDKKDPVIMISNFCLITGLEMSGEITIECSDYEEKDNDSSPIKWNHK